MILDPLHEYHDGYIVYSFLEIRECIRRNFFRGDFRLICRFVDDDDIDYLFRFLWFIENLLLIVEEADKYIEDGNNYFEEIVRRGRHKGLSLLCIAHRVVDIPTFFRSEINSLITFSQGGENGLTSNPADIIRLESMGFDREKLLNIKQREYLLLGEQINLEELYI